MSNIFTHTDGGLLTAENCAVTFIDHQPQMLFGVANIERQSLINNVVLLAKCAKLFGVPAVLTSVETESFSGYIWPQLLDIFPDQKPIERTSMNSWDDAAFREAIKKTGKKNIIMAGLWTEVCVAWPTLNMINEGYNVFVVDDASGADELMKILRDHAGAYGSGVEYAYTMVHKAPQARKVPVGS